MKTEFKASIKMFAFLMAVIMLIASLPVYAFAGLVEKEEEQAEKLTETAADVIVLEEDKTLRDESIKHFKLSDGTTKAVIYSQPVHYKSEDGEWIDIDNSLTLNGNEYSSKNKQEIKFANKSGSNGLVSIKDGEYKIDFTPLDTSKVRVEIENPQENNSRKFEDVSKLNNLVAKAIYKNIYDGIDIEYILVGNNLKENIIVNEKQDSYTYIFELKLNKLSAELKDGAIVLSDCDSGEPVYKIPAPYMYDANGVYSEAVEYTLEQNSKWNYTFTVTADTEWINADDRAFPVTIDPMIVTDVADEDTYVMNGYADNGDLNTMIIGSFFGGEVLGFVKFNEILEASNQRILVDARLSMYLNAVYNSSNLDFYIGIHECTRAWTNDSSFSHATSDQYYSSSIESSLRITGAGAYDWDITELYKKWQNVSNSNFGLCVKAVNLPYDSGTYAGILTRDHTASYMAPRMELTYVDLLGVEDYYAYASTTLGTTGESYINLYNGSLTYINKLTSVSVGNLTYDINMVYNSIEKCWKPSFAESITTLDYDARNDAEEATDGESSYDNIYLWQDPDGTTHAFTPYLQKNSWGEYVPYVENADGTLTEVQNPTVFYPEDDIDYVLEKTTSNDFILKDYLGNQKLFDSNGRLSRICDAQGNVLYINNYLDENNISQIYIQNSIGEVMSLVDMKYKTNGNLYFLYDYQHQLEITVEWLSNLRIEDISYRYENQETHNSITFTYFDTSKLLGAVEESYSSNRIGYVKLTNDDKYYEFREAINNSEYRRCVFEYDENQTTFSDVGHDLVLNTSDDISRLFVFDNRGRKTSIVVENDIQYYYYTTDILPEDSYYDVEFSRNIYNEGFNLVSYEMATRETGFVKLDVQNTINTNTVSTNQVDVANSIVENTQIDPYKMVCQILVYYDDLNPVSYSTGFLSGSNTVVLSGHAILKDVTSNGIRDFVFPSRIEVIPGQYVDANGMVCAPFGIYEVTKCYIQKEYYYVSNQESFEAFEYDWAVCVLDENIGDQIGYFDLMITPENTKNKYVEIIGYEGTTEKMHKLTGKITSNSGNRIYYNATTSGGISGSPVFFNNGSYVVCGIHTSNAPGGTKINSLIYSLVDSLILID